MVAEVGVAELRRNLKDYLDEVRRGEEVVVTDRGTPVARLTGIDVKPVLDRLVEQGVLTRAPRSKKTVAHRGQRVTATGPVSEYVVAERDAKRS